jgi:DNA repair exonuclease SbcCD ATPase subunit
MQRDNINSLKQTLSELEQQQRIARAHAEKCKQTLVRHKRQEQELQLEIQRAEDAVEELKEATDKDSLEDGRLDVLRATLQEAEEEKRVNEGSYGDGVVAMDALVEKLKEIKRELAAKDDEITSYAGKVRDLEAEEVKLLDNRRKALGDKNGAICRGNELKQEKIHIERKRDQITARILDFNEKANIVSPRVRVDEGETAQSLDKKLEKLAKDLRRYNDECVHHFDWRRLAISADNIKDGSVQGTDCCGRCRS